MSQPVKPPENPLPHLVRLVNDPQSFTSPTALAEWTQKKTTGHFYDAAAHFLLSLKSPNTRRSYAGDLQDFQEFCGSRGNAIFLVKDISQSLVLEWAHHLEEKHSYFPKSDRSKRRVVQASVKRKLSSLSSFLNFAERLGLVDTNVARIAPRPSIEPASKTNALTQEEVNQMLGQARLDCERTKGTGGRPYAAARLRFACLYTLLSVGMRASELCELRLGDVESTAEWTKLHMTSKGNETHAPIIHPVTAQIINEYIAEFRRNASPQEYLFTRAQRSQKSTRLSQQALYNMVTELAKSAGVEKRLSPHSCRATLATLLHGNGVPVGEIQDLLGHKQLTTTAIYIKKADAWKEAAALKIDVLGKAGRTLKKRSESEVAQNQREES